MDSKDPLFSTVPYLTPYLFPGIHQKFKLITTISLTNMVLHDKDGILKKYESPAEIMKVQSKYKLTLSLYLLYNELYAL